MPPSINLDQMPFSRRETNYAISKAFSTQLGEFGTVNLRHIYGGQKPVIFQWQAIKDGDEIETDVSATPSLLSMSAPGGSIEVIMPEPNCIRIRCFGIGLRMIGKGPQWSLIIPARSGQWRSIIGRSKLHWVPLKGELKVDAPWRPSAGGRHRHHGCDPMIIEIPPESDIMLFGYESEIVPPAVEESFDAAQARVQEDFDRWLAASPPAPERYATQRELAAYISWSSVVPTNGNFKSPAMLMSKNWMVNTWNWDNYFNAWAGTYRDPAFAWDQYMLHIGHQHETGALGDGINELEIGWSYTKPPVHGWILKHMMAISDEIGIDQVREAYGPLCRWTEWWFTYRDDDKDGICQYHHGNDSGWDDASAFDIGSPAEAPDLTALLVIQMEVLAELAEMLGKSAEAAGWKQRSESTLAAFLKHSRRDGQFVTMESGTHRYGGSGDSLLNYIPVILGARLPESVMDDLIAGLTKPGRFLTEWGLATEAVSSPEYLQQGYWRGAIWPPPMMMIIDGLLHAGRMELANDLAERYCRMCALHGFGENHDALTGEIHYDSAYTWATSVWQILAAEVLH